MPIFTEKGKAPTCPGIRLAPCSPQRQNEKMSSNLSAENSQEQHQQQFNHRRKQPQPKELQQQQQQQESVPKEQLVQETKSPDKKYRETLNLKTQEDNCIEMSDEEASATVWSDCTEGNDTVTPVKPRSQPDVRAATCSLRAKKGRILPKTQGAPTFVARFFMVVDST